MPQDVYEQLVAASQPDLAPVYLNEPCSEQELADFRQQVREQFGEDGADWYERLLAITNGAQIDHSYFYNASDFIGNNRERREDDPAFAQVLVSGSSGNVDLYIYAQQQGTMPFRIVNFFGVDEMYEEYATFEAMFAALLDAAIAS